MKVIFAVLASALAVAPTANSDVAESGRVPLVGVQGPQTDACPGIGRIAKFAPKKGDFMRIYPDAHDGGKPKDKLSLATLVWLCEADEDWQGIVYPTGDNQELGDCRVSSAVANPEPYKGPCQYGWVEAKYINLVAG